MSVYASTTVFILSAIALYAIYYMYKVYARATKSVFIDVETVDEDGNTVIAVKEVE